MIEPGLDALLLGVATRLENDVLPDLQSDPARRQLKAALAIVRRVASVWDQVIPTLARDNLDLDRTLRSLAEPLARAGAQPDSLREMLETAVPVSPEVSYEQLREQHRALQRVLVEVEGRLAGIDEGPEHRAIGETLRTFHSRSVSRERLLTGR